MGHHQVSTERKGPKSEPFLVPTQVMKNQLRSNVPALSSALQNRVTEAMAMEVAPRNGTWDSKTSQVPSIVLIRERSISDLSDEKDDTWQTIRLFPALLRILTRINLLVFVGENHGR